MSLRYSITWDGSAAGTAESTVNRSGSQVQYRWAVKNPTNESEQVATFDAEPWRLRAAHLRPVTDGQPRYDITVDTALIKGWVTNEEARSDVSWPVTGEIAPSGMEDAFFLFRDLRVGEEIRVPSLEFRTGLRGAIIGEVVGQTTIQVPAGEFEVYELDLRAEPGGTIGEQFIRTEAPHVIVRADLGRAVLELVEFEGASG